MGKNEAPRYIQKTQKAVILRFSGWLMIRDFQ